jgi:hypothetical protein
MGQKNLNYLLDVLKKSQVKLELGDSLNKELDDLLKNSPLESEYKNSYYKSTNFTPKKKPSLFARFKKSVNNFFKKIKNSKVVKFIFNLWSNNVTKPIQERKAKKSREKYVKELKKNFNETFNVDTNHINKLIDATKPNLNEDYKIDHLIENSVEINKLKSKGKVAPFIYEPEIVDIHNENLNLENPELHKLIDDDGRIAKNELTKQENFIKRKEKLTADGYKK